MMRAVALAARLDFTIDPPILRAIRVQRHEIAQSSPARLLEEYYKILRAGAAEKTFRGLASAKLLEPISPELQRGAADPLWGSLAAVDAYRSRFDSAPDSLTNAVLLGSLLVPLGLAPQPVRWPRPAPQGGQEDGQLDTAVASHDTRQRPAGLQLRHSAARAARRRATTASARVSAPAPRPGRQQSDAARLGPTERLSGCADMARHPRRSARGRGALDHARSRRTGRSRGRRRRRAPAIPTETPAAEATRVSARGELVPGGTTCCSAAAFE